MTTLPPPDPGTYSLFDGFIRVARGTRAELLAFTQGSVPQAPVLRTFDDYTGCRIDLDARPPRPAAESASPRGPGRPRLGVVAREVTLLPRHWEWLALQPGGASVALRRLVEEARRTHAPRDAARAAREAAYRFMSAVAGDLPGFEEASRALFAGDAGRFAAQVAGWPEDVRGYAQQLAAGAWEPAA
ncbi:DUF2239 family protein [Xylophilus sp.]|uniref:DUF2239 family protein n=1 Tax=Xylophilus sp. TaxID=2653893 RepID=UPI0013BE27CB|nr:DUF2239 family protein [Xylophilus sp.]KAF1048723.1 MAG: hypothetical protein GAK38_01167 [Xylophilus sp.]